VLLLLVFPAVTVLNWDAISSGDTALKDGKAQWNVLLVVNCGGWGNVPLEESPDIFPIVKGVAGYLDSCGLRPGVAVYQRAVPEDLSAHCPVIKGQISVLGEMLGFHRQRVNRFVQEIESVARRYPEQKFILIGLSNGATFANQTVEAFSPAVVSQVFSIEIGIPFWRRVVMTENNLILTNGGADPLWRGAVEELFTSLLKGLKDFFWRQIGGAGGSFEEVWHIHGHDYRWEKVAPAVRVFIDRRIVGSASESP